MPTYHPFPLQGLQGYRGTSLIRSNLTLGPYSATMPRALWWSGGGGLFLMSEVSLYLTSKKTPPPRTLP